MRAMKHRNGRLPEGAVESLFYSSGFSRPGWTKPRDTWSEVCFEQKVRQNNSLQPLPSYDSDVIQNQQV